MPKNQDQQLVRIERLLQAARIEAAGLRPADHLLRRAICADLDDMLRTLRASVEAVLIKHVIDGARADTRGTPAHGCVTNQRR